MLKPCPLGAHTSTAGGLHNALLAGQEIGASTIQIFTSNQKQWKGREITDEILLEWNRHLRASGISQIMSHASYLINLGAVKPEVHAKSLVAFQAELKRCHALGISYLNFHPGSAVGGTVEACLDKITQSLLEMEPLILAGDTLLVLESTAGQGSCVGHRFEELAYIIEKVKHRFPIAVCVDTCHTFAAGYDLTTSAAVDATLNTFDEIIGLEHLVAFHLNDSQHICGSRRDRHAELGKGEIGIECFKALMQDPRTQPLPKYLETPGRMNAWAEEIKCLREFEKEFCKHAHEN